MTKQDIEKRIKDIEQKFESPSFFSETPTKELSSLISEFNDLNKRLEDSSFTKKRKCDYKRDISGHMDGYKFINV